MAVKVAFLIADDVQWNGKGPPRSLWQVSYSFSHSSSRAWLTAGPHFMHSLRALRLPLLKKLGLSYRQDKYAIFKAKD